MNPLKNVNGNLNPESVECKQKFLDVLSIIISEIMDV